MADNKQWTNACTVDQLAANGQFEYVANGKPILICRSGARLFAIDGRCSHKQRALLGGKIRDDQLSCPHHAACFDLQTGRAVKGPAFKALQVFPVRQNNHWIQVRLAC